MNMYLSFMQRMLLIFAGFVCASNVSAYDFKVANGDGVTIYYDINGDDATVTSGDEKYTGDVKIPASVTYEDVCYNVTAIGSKAFDRCRNLTSIEIPSSVTGIGSYAFHYCDKLASVTIPGSVESIGASAFGFCGSIVTVQFTEGLVSIGSSAFESCAKLQAVCIPSSVTHIGEGAFSNNVGMASISVEPENGIYDSRDSSNAIIETATNTLIQGCMTTKIPNGIVAIGSKAFDRCRNLTSIEIPSSVTGIGSYAFHYCDKLTKVVSKIREPFKISSDVFSYIPNSAVLYVPVGTKEAYKSVGGWCSFADIIEIELCEFADKSIRTFCSAEALDFSDVDGLNAYIASGFNAETGDVIMSKVEKVPAKTGLLLMGEAGNSYKIPISETDYIYSNLLVGVLENKQIETGFIFNGDLFEAIGETQTVKAGEAYLDIAIGNAKQLNLRFTDTDAIESVQLSDKNHGVWHTLQGIRFNDKPVQRGIYLYNGRKVFVK